MDPLFEKACKLAEEFEVDVRTSRIAGRQRHRANANVPGESVKEYYKLNVHSH